MKIALLHYAAPPIVGGVESVIGHHARLMADAGHDVRVIAGRGDQFDSRIRFIQLPLVDSRHPNILSLKSDLDAGRVPNEFNPLTEQIAAQLRDATADSDWLIAHNICSLSKNLALTAALKRLSESKTRPRLILWHHDLAWTTPRYRNELHDGYPWDLLRTDWPRAIQVAVSESRRQELAQLLGIETKRIHVIPNGIEVNQFLKLAPQTQEFIKRLDLLSAAPLLLLPVRITPRKNIELALRVLSELRAEFKRAMLVVTGPLGPHNPANVEYFERLVALRGELKLDDAAHFLAEINDQYLPDEVVSDFYRLADALFYPSREEGFGIPILEAGLSSIPIFCSDIQPLRELGKSQAAYFAPDQEPKAVAMLIMDWLKTNPLSALRRRIRSDYLWKQIYSNEIAPLLENG